MEIAILILLIVNSIVLVTIFVAYFNSDVSVSDVNDRIDGFEKESAEASKSLGQFMIKLAEEMQVVDNRLVEIDKRLGQEIADTAQDLSEINSNIMRMMEHRNLINVGDNDIENYIRYRQ